MSTRSLRQQRAPAPRRAVLRSAARAAAAAAQPPVTIVSRDGTRTAFDKARLVLGSGAAADLHLAGAGVASEHAALERRGGRIFARALADGDLLSPTATWIAGAELRPGVDYLLAPGALLVLGELGGGGAELTLDFEEPDGGGGAAAMLMQAMASSDAVREQLAKGL